MGRTRGIANRARRGLLACLTVVAALAAGVSVLGQQSGVSVRAEVEPSQVAAGQPATLRLIFQCIGPNYVQAGGLNVRVALPDALAGAVTVGEPRLPAPRTKHDALLDMTVEYYDGRFTVDVPVQTTAAAPVGTHELSVHLDYVACAPEICRFEKADLRPVLVVAAGAAEAAVEPEPEQPVVTSARPVLTAAPPAAGSVEEQVQEMAGRGVLVVVLLAFAAGLGLAFTPCVYPLIPVTVALVGATSGRTRLGGFVRALAYVLGISTTYGVMGLIASATGGVFGAVLQHPAVYLALAAVFVVMAGAMFDLYSFTLASGRLQQLQARLRGRAGLVGIYAIGLLSGAAATACAAPIIAALFAYVGQRGDPALGFLVFLALGLGIGTPLLVVGTFTGLLTALPKSGEWLSTVKRVMGLGLLGAAVYFVGHSMVLPQFWYGALVAAFLLGAGVFVGAFDVLTAGSGWWPRVRKTAGLILLAAAVVAFAGTLHTGGMPPAGGVAPSVDWLTSEPEAFERAEAEGKPVLLDFWTETCVACHEMFRTTWRDPRVVEESRRFICAKLDLTESGDPEVKRLIEEYDVRGAPLIVLMGTDGVRQSYQEYVGPAQMRAIMAGVR